MQVQRWALVSLVTTVLSCVAISAIALLLAATPAQAHAQLLGTTPKAGSTLTSAPSVVVLQFDEPVLRLGLTVRVTGPAGRVDDGPARLAGAGVLQPLKPGLPTGAYRVVWKVTSDDGHPVAGTFGFTAGRSGTGGAGAASPSAGASSKPTRATPASSAADAPAAAPTTSPGPSASTIAAGPTSGSGGSSSTRWTIAGIAIVVLALLAAVIATLRPRRRAAGPSAPPND